MPRDRNSTRYEQFSLPVKSGFDTAVVALWLGHADIRSAAAYLHADMTIKEQALERMATISTPGGRYRPGDTLLAFLDSL